MQVEASNDAMAEGWNGSTGDFWTDNADLFDAGVAAYLAPLLAAAAVRPGEDVLDVGCGAGETTPHRGDVLRRSARGLTNLAGALRPGGRIALAVWAAYADQEWIRSFRGAATAGREVPPPPPGAPHAFSLSDPDHVRGLLARAGFADVRLDAVREPMFFGGDVAAAEHMALGLVGGMLDELDQAARAGARDALRASLQEHLGPDGVTYRSAMWIVTARVPA